MPRIFVCGGSESVNRYVEINGQSVELLEIDAITDKIKKRVSLRGMNTPGWWDEYHRDVLSACQELETACERIVDIYDGKKEFKFRHCLGDNDERDYAVMAKTEEEALKYYRNDFPNGTILGPA